MLTPEQISVVEQRRREGFGSRLIARELGVHRHVIRKWIEKHERPQANSPDNAGNPAPLPPYHVKTLNTHPKGWEPGVKWDKDSGTVVWKGEDGDSFEDVLNHLGFDPDKYRVVGEVDARTWDMPTADGIHTARYFRAKIVPSIQDKEFDSDLLDLLNSQPSRKRQHESHSSSLIVNLADWQIGKRDGDGTKGVIERAKLIGPAIADRVFSLRPRYKIDQIVIAGLGDLFEGCDGHYAQQTYTTEVNRRQQANIIRRLLLDIVVYVSQIPNVDVLVVAVGGNHGENRRDGKSFTDFSDNDDLAVFDQLKDIFAQSAVKNVSFVIPTEELSVTLNISGQIITWAHGHQFRKGTHPADKMVQWLKGQALGRHPAGDSDILISGHFHFLIIMQESGRWLIQSPALESDSKWFRDAFGGKANPATVTFVVTERGPEEFYLI